MVEHLAHQVLGFCLDYMLGTPLRFSPAMAEIFCLGWLPPRRSRPTVTGLVCSPTCSPPGIRFAGRRRAIPERAVRDGRWRRSTSSRRRWTSFPRIPPNWSGQNNGAGYSGAAGGRHTGPGRYGPFRGRGQPQRRDRRAGQIPGGIGSPQALTQLLAGARSDGPFTPDHVGAILSRRGAHMAASESSVPGPAGPDMAEEHRPVARGKRGQAPFAGTALRPAFGWCPASHKRSLSPFPGWSDARTPADRYCCRRIANCTGPKRTCNWRADGLLVPMKPLNPAAAKQLTRNDAVAGRLLRVARLDRSGDLCDTTTERQPRDGGSARRSER